MSNYDVLDELHKVRENIKFVVPKYEDILDAADIQYCRGLEQAINIIDQRIQEILNHENSEWEKAKQ